MTEQFTYPKKHFRGQTQDEKVILFFRRHWIVLLKYFFYCLILCALFTFNSILLITFASTSSIETNPMFRVYFTVSTLFILVSGISIFTHLINYYLDIVIITTLRVVEVKKTIFFKNKVHGIDLTNVQEIKAEKEGFISNSLSFGNIILSSPSNHLERIITIVPTPHYYSDIITKLRHGNDLTHMTTEL